MKCEKCSRYLKKNRSTCAIEIMNGQICLNFVLIVKRIFDTKNFTRLSHFSINSFFKLKNKYYHAIKKIFKMSCIEKFSINNYYWSNFNDTINFNFRNTIFLLRQIESTISSSTSTVTSSKLFAELVCWVCISPFILSTTRHGTRGHFVKDEIRGYTNFFFFFFFLSTRRFLRGWKMQSEKLNVTFKKEHGSRLTFYEQ